MACAVPYCRSYARLLKKTGETIGFHRFPVSNNLRKKFDAVGRNNWTPKKHHRICSKHFETNCFIIIKNIKHLLPDAIPTVFQRPLEVSPDGEFPENICMNCIYHLTMTYSFKNLIESSAKTLAETSNSVQNDDIDYSYESDEDGKTYQMKKYGKRKNCPIENTTVSDMKLMFCVECKAEFHSSKELSAHCINNHPVKSMIGRDCDYCHEKFEDFRSLVLHRKLHMKPYLCENCWEGFFSENELNAHSCQPNGHHKEKNSSDRMLRQCDQCGKSYPPGYIRIHMLTHSNDRPYSCKYCPKKFKVPGGLHSHILWNHKRTRNHKCEVCNATFISSSSRSTHIRKNHLKEKKYGCESCGKRFFSKSELQRHSLTHTGVKNFHCHLCDKSYQTRYGLNVHLKSHSQMSMDVLNL